MELKQGHLQPELQGGAMVLEAETKLQPGLGED